jgi:hypothetical protein
MVFLHHAVLLEFLQVLLPSLQGFRFLTLTQQLYNLFFLVALEFDSTLPQDFLLGEFLFALGMWGYVVPMS